MIKHHNENNKKKPVLVYGVLVVALVLIGLTVFSHYHAQKKQSRTRVLTASEDKQLTALALEDGNKRHEEQPLLTQAIASIERDSRPSPAGLKAPSLVYRLPHQSNEKDSHRGAATFPHSLARHMTQPSCKLFQGKILHAVLETAINSKLPGLVRAVLSRDVYSEDGQHIVLPKGTRLVGMYQSRIAREQSRVFVIWQRAITPDHTDVLLKSPASDAIGAVGIAGEVDSHFWQQFRMSSLLSVLGVGVSQLQMPTKNPGLNGNAYQHAVGSSFFDASKQALHPHRVSPTIYIAPGNVMTILVARDIDFSSTDTDGLCAM